MSLCCEIEVFCLQCMTKAVVSLWKKYAVALTGLLPERDQVAEELDGFLKELGCE